MRILCIHAHFDDFEFVAAGTFERWRRQLGVGLKAKLIVCTDGRSGHHARTRAETARLRLAEQEASARLGQIEFELLRTSGGDPFVEACGSVSNELLAALWKVIREFEPDYLFCPPLPADTLAGVHPDHITVAEAVRRVAYMINVPHAFLDEYPAADETQSRWIKTPVILNTYDGYMAGANGGDLVVDVEPVFDQIAEMSWCHQSQICEWLPWIGRHNMPPVKSLTEWKAVLRQRFQRQQRELGLPLDRAAEMFTVTAWGTVPTLEQLERDFPGLIANRGRTEGLCQKLQRWSG